MKFKLYWISADGGQTWTEQWLSEEDADNERKAGRLVINQLPRIAENTQYGGFVFNMVTNTYDMLFITEMSALLARNRAIGHALYRNETVGKEVYNINDVIVKERAVAEIFSPWSDME